ncbi:MAG: hypothetical protein RLZZ502_1899 [Pseudomonadota bacterium]|jgi:nitrate/nitrite transport system ATP-binding protein
MDTLLAPVHGRLIKQTHSIVVDKVRKVFATKNGDFLALRDISLSIRQGEFVSLIGHSGCGKSTLLNLIAGLDTCSAGNIICSGREVRGPGPDRGVVFQNHSLLPWLTCYQNIYLAVERVFGATESKAQCRARSLAALALVKLSEAAEKFPHEISGGMKQRVGIARALAIEPQVLLLDEPFGALDALTRASLQDELMRIVAASKCTVVMVTHDLDEAVLLADTVVMMRVGNADMPGAVIARTLAIDLPRPRERLALADQASYHALRKEILDFLYGEHQ